ncbi:MAG: pyruvate dehydrogenase (acetyl-transferring) E1 component subunit alpha [Phycisphaerales bacterium]|nr:pyruvate dehydrogenase (acetyl-transferring) E1 component subunit alpha [Phycisphaerales bacterium]
MTSLTDPSRSSHADIHGASAGSSRHASGKPELPAPVLLGWLRDMYRIREFETRCMQAYQEKKIGGFCHVYIGQEAVAVGCTAAVEPTDPIVTAYRDHGHALARGMTSRACMAEMYGRIDGCAKGKGGSMHMFDRNNNLFGGHGIVGAQTPLGAGLAFGTKYMDEVIDGGTNRRVTLCFLGDGALNQGAFHEACNLAGLFDLPVVYVCENNGYSMGTSIHRGTTMGHNLRVKAEAYGLDSMVIDGMDILEVYHGMKVVCDRARANSRPAFVDMRTYRYKGHSMSDPRKYRSREEEEVWEASDPVQRLRNRLETSGLLTDEAWKQLTSQAKAEARDSLEFADASPVPPLSDLYRDVYAERWGPYTGSSQPLMNGGSENTPSFTATEGKEGIS